jgi:hypothetical protein
MRSSQQRPARNQPAILELQGFTALLPASQGYGSYPADMQTCDVFQMVYQVAKRFYLLFQQHSNEARAERDGLKVLGREGFSQLVQLGPKVALALPDCRSSRSRRQVRGWACAAACGHVRVWVHALVNGARWAHSDV